MARAPDSSFYSNGINAANGQPAFQPHPASVDDIVEMVLKGSRDDAEAKWFSKWARQVVEDAHYNWNLRPNLLKIEEAGWGVLFPEDVNPEIREALSDLLRWRQAQAMTYYQELVYHAGEDRFQFLKRHKMGAFSRSDPKVIPYYLLIVGSPSEIPFAFENALSYQFAVGRIYFDAVEDYVRYAQTVVQAERLALSLPRTMAFYGSTHPESGFMIEALKEKLGEALPEWSIRVDQGEAASKTQLQELIGAPASPALLFYAGHGIVAPENHPERQTLQGSLYCSGGYEFPENRPISATSMYSAEDLASDAQVLGKIVFLCSSYALGTPHSRVEGGLNKTSSKHPIPSEPFVAPLPQRLLAHPNGGALAVLGPTDLIWNSTQPSVANALYGSLRSLMSSYPVGYAIEPLKNLSAEAINALNQGFEDVDIGERPGGGVASHWVTQEMTRSLAIFGDPAVRLPVQMAGEESNQTAVASRLSEELRKIRNRVSIKTAPAQVVNAVPELPTALIEALNLGQCTVFLGGRLSEQVGYPSREDFARRLLQWSIYTYDLKDPRYIQEIQRSINGGESNFAIDSLVTRVKEQKLQDVFLKFVRDAYQKPDISIPNAYEFLRALPFSAAITPNLDGLTENIYGIETLYTPQEAEYLLEALSKQKFFLLKMRGWLEKPDTVIVSNSQFKELVLGNLKFVNFLQSLFLSRMVLFLGMPLEELLSYLDVLSGFTSARTHYILTPTSEPGWQPKAEVLQQRFGIQVLPYRETVDQDSLAAFLENLSKAVSRRSKTRKPASSPSWLKRVRLENIGPFELLELDLNKSWNILLGDNGVGKSNILRGIAAGILGQDIQPFAERLIRSGSLWGQITLETNYNQTYVTRLEMGSTGVQVTSTGGRPLETEGWLVLGYPPTRTVTWTDVKAQVGEFARRPTIEDLLPLVRGDIDPRLDKLKQSFIDLELRISKGTRAEVLLSKRLRAAYMHILQRVTGNIQLEYAGIKNNRVMFTTDDGEVRIEALSQGTASLMGWVGYLVERLYEVYDQSKDPTKKYALVLIDEIDAHMHPEWQRQLAGHLKSIFPKVQFIASTHSPLIPVTLEPEEVLRLRRDPDEPGTILVEKLEEDMRRWQANQVLTSSLFNLGSTMAPEMEQATQTYTRLVWREDLSEDEQQALRRAAELLRIDLPRAMEREEARQAFEMIEAALKARIEEIPLEKRQSMMDEVRTQILENVTGARRPL